MRHPSITANCEFCQAIFHPVPSLVAGGGGRFCSRDCFDKSKSTRKLDQRFWVNVDKNGPLHPRLKTRCWLWTGTCSEFGHGRLWNGKREEVAHRVSYELHNGPISEDKDILHHCDIPPCVNPEHIYAGTPLQNMRDKMERSRQGDCGPKNPPRGERHPHAKFTAGDIRQIRELYATGKYSQQAIADRFGTAQACISRFVIGKAWKHITK